MAFLAEQETYESGIYQIELTDPIQGGADGISNLQAKQLANRTKYLKARFEAGHTTAGAHKVTELQADLAGALGDAQIATGAAIAESKTNLYFRGALRPGGLGTYDTTRDIADDIMWLASMNSLGDLLLNKTTLDIARDLCTQFYSSSGILYSGATALSGHTAVIDGSDGGGIFTIDTATEDMMNKLQISGLIQFLIDGYCIPIKAPTTIELPEANDVYTTTVRNDLVYVRIHHENVTLTNVYYDQSDMAGTAIDWSGLTESEQKIAAVGVENNLYVGADYNVYQIQYEIVAVADKSTLLDVGYTATVGDSYLYENGIYKAIQLVKVARRNKGAYHSVFNAAGTAVFYGDSIVLEENQNTHSGPSYSILSGATGDGTSTFVIAGDHESELPVGAKFNVTGAIDGEVDNSRDYEVSAVAYVDPNTTVTVTSNVATTSGANGQINTGWPAAPFYDIASTSTTYQQFIIAGDHEAEFPVGHDIEVIGTATNDEDYTVTAVEYTGGNTVITVDAVIDNTGNTGKLHSITWFHINYCFTHRAVGLDSIISGSVASGIAASSASSTMDELTEAHDHFKNADITDLRVFLETATRVTDANLTLNTPVITGLPVSAYELQTVVATIDPYNAAYTYAMTVTDVATGSTFGSLTQDGATVTWVLPEITANATVQITISATDASSHISQTRRYNVQVYNLSILGDDAILTESTDWTTLVNATSTAAGITSTAGTASAYTDSFVQEVGEADWGKFQVTVQRDLTEWTVGSGSTVSSLVLEGTTEVAAGKLYAVQYTGSTDVVVTDLGVDSVSWNGSTANTLTLSEALAELPLRVWSWDAVVSTAVGTETEALVEATSLSVTGASTTTSQVVGTNATEGLWVNGGYHDTVTITVSGVEKTVPVQGVSESAGTYTLQIPVQAAAPTAAVKPTCFAACASPLSLEYNATDGTVDAVYPEQVAYASDIRQLRLATTITGAGVVLKPVTVDLWKEIAG